MEQTCSLTLSSGAYQMIHRFRKSDRAKVFCKKDPWLIASFAVHTHLKGATVKIDVKQGLELENFPSSGGFGHGDFKRTLGRQYRLLFHRSMLLGFTICLDKCSSHLHTIGHCHTRLVIACILC